MTKTTRFVLTSVAAILSLTSLALAQGPGGFDGPPPGGGSPRGMPPFPILLALDADHDGTISAKEIANASAALKKLDKNRDGKLTEEEMRPKFGGPGGHEGWQRPSPAELVSRLMQGMMARADANKDGVLTKAELQKFAQSAGASSW